MAYRGFASLAEIPDDTSVINRPGMANVAPDASLSRGHPGLYKTVKMFFFREASLALADEREESVMQIEKRVLTGCVTQPVAMPLQRAYQAK